MEGEDLNSDKPLNLADPTVKFGSLNWPIKAHTLTKRNNNTAVIKNETNQNKLKKVNISFSETKKGTILKITRLSVTGRAHNDLSYPK